MVMNINLDNDGIKEAINCYLKSRLINAHTYAVTVRIIAGRSGDKQTDRAELLLSRKDEFAYLDKTLNDADPIEEVEMSTVRIAAKESVKEEEEEEEESQEDIEAPAYMDGPVSPDEETAVKKSLPTAPMGGSLFRKAT